MKKDTTGELNLENDGLQKSSGKFEGFFGKLDRVVRGYSTKSLIAFALILVALPTTVYLARQQVNLKTMAAALSGQAEFTFAGTNRLPPNQNITLRLDSANRRVSFVRAEFTFDPAKVRLSGEVTTTDRFKTTMQKTTMAAANSSGRMIIMVGLSPEDRENPPSGLFDFATIPLTAVSTVTNDTTRISIDLTASQVVDSDSLVLTNLSTPLNLTLNFVSPTATRTPTAGPTATRTPTPRPTTVPTAGPTATRTPTPRPTALPTARPTATRTPTPRPTTLPTARPTATRTPTPRPTAWPTLRPTATVTPRPTSITFPTRVPTRVPFPTATRTPLPTPTRPPFADLTGDVNGDRCVNYLDAQYVWSKMYRGYDSRADINRDGRVTWADLMIIARNWQNGCR